MSGPRCILAIDTAFAACSVAVIRSGTDCRAVAHTLPMDRGQAEALVPLIGRVLTESGVDAGTLDAIAVTIGPGSFTGLRVGLATARGLALAAACPVLGVTCFEPLADAALDQGEDGPFTVLIDTRRGDAYAQTFQGRTDTGKPRPVGDARIVAERLDRGARLIRADGTAIDPPGGFDDSGDTVPDPLRIARLAQREPTPAPLRPLYLRPADAVPAANGGRLWA